MGEGWQANLIQRQANPSSELRQQIVSAGPTTQVLEVLRYRANTNHQLELLQQCLEV